MEKGENVLLSRFNTTVMLLHATIVNRIYFPADKNKYINNTNTKLHTNIVPLYLQSLKIVRRNSL